MKNKNINEEIRKFCDEMTKTETKAAILSTDKGIMVAGTGAELLSVLTMALRRMRELGCSEELLKDAFELSKLSGSEIEKRVKTVSEKKLDNKIEKIEKMLNLLKEINNE